MSIKLKGSSDGSVSFDAPSDTSPSGTDVSFTLPTADGTSGQILNTNGSGALSFANVAPFLEVDIWRLTADKQGENNDVSTNLERVDDSYSSYIGTGMSQSSGIFTFPQTGIYFVLYTAQFVHDGDDNSNLQMYVSTDGGTNWDQAAQCADGNTAGNDRGGSATSFAIVDVTNTSNVKVKFRGDSFAASSRLLGNSDHNETHFLFVRIGDT